MDTEVEGVMKIGCVMPTLNQSLYLVAALDSYFAQTHPSTLVVVDDGSTDGTHELLKRYYDRIGVITHPINKGTAEAINTGITHLPPECDALTWISSDNNMTPDWLATLVRVMESNGAGAVYAGFWYEKPGKKPLYLFTPYSKDLLLNTPRNCHYGPAFLIRKDAWVPHRGKIAHDYANWLAVEEYCWKHNLPIIGVDRPLCHYNAHDQRATVVRASEFDAFEHRAEAKKRRSGES